MGINSENNLRGLGSRLITVEKLTKLIKEHFAPESCYVQFFDDASGLAHVRVDNEDGTFQVFDYHSKPSYIDLLNQILRPEGTPPIIELKATFTSFSSDEEFDILLNQLCKEHNYPRELFIGIGEKEEKDPKWRFIRSELNKWSDLQIAYCIFHEGDEEISW